MLRSFFLIGFVVAALSPPGAQAATISLRADEWCPYNCASDSDRPGYMIEIARVVFEEAGHVVDYQTLNWSRSLAETRKGRFSGVIGATRDEVPDFVFGPALGFSNDSFAVRPGTVIDTRRDDPFDGLTLGAIRGYDYYKPVNDFIEAHGDDRAFVQFTFGDDALEQNLRKLVDDRVDFVIDDGNVLRRTIHDLGFAANLLVIETDEPEEVHIAFSPEDPNAEAYAAILRAGVEQLRRSGKLDDILARYGLRDWEGKADR